MEYNFRDIEKKWQRKWIDDKVYQVSNHSSKPKCYVLDMFPYPSGAGLHVGHPLGYIASDIYARYKRLKGYNVLHPMGYDAFGLPAEQYAIEHGVHPAVSTEKNIATFRKQLDNIGFSFDWSREVRTSDPKYYKWTQWIFLQLFKSWYNRKTNKTEHIDDVIKIFKEEGNANHPIPNSQFSIPDYPHIVFSAAAWKNFDEKTQQAILMEYRIAYCGYGEVNWCEALGTVLANDEVINGVSERGGYPVEKKRLRQWYLRITEYADRLLEGLQTVDFSEAMKEMQSNWIGKSEGAEITFLIARTSPPAPIQSRPGRERGETESLVEEPFPKYNVKDRVQFENARINRKQSTEAETMLWERLRNNQLGCKFRRQHPVEGFITDFACLQKGLIVEVDNGYHNTKDQQEYVALRTTILEQKGFTILRFTNEEVLENVFAVRDKIKAALAIQKEIKSTNDTTPIYLSDGEEVGFRDKTKSAIVIQKEYKTVSEQTPLSISDGEGLGVRCFTTRPDTIFGVDFLVLAPEHQLVKQITTSEQKVAVEEYIAYVKSRSERERMTEKKISGVFTGAYAQHPFSEKQIPIWIAEYVLAGYGTGAIMGVPSGDERDHKFAKHFDIPITNIAGAEYNGEEAYSSKELVLENSDFLTGMNYDGAFEVVIKKLEEKGMGKRKVNYKMRDAAFSRQRYWGEPFPIIWKDGIAYPLEESELPLELPYVESYKPGPEGEGPLANIPEYLTPGPSPSSIKRGVESVDAVSVPLSIYGEGLGVRRETNTMPGYAGSSWYFLRYMDPRNEEIFCDKNISAYWNQVDLYVGGTEHAVGHLLYSRMWTKALYDLGLITFDEPFKRLLNQGMIQGSSRFVYQINTSFSLGQEGVVHATRKFPQAFVSEKYYKNFLNNEVSAFDLLRQINQRSYVYDLNETTNYTINPIHVDIDFVDGKALDIKGFRNSRSDFNTAIFIFEDGSISFSKDEDNNRKYICGVEIEKMSKRFYNVVNPDDLVEKYGADTFRMYEMFLGPVEMSKPWDTKGIEGVHRFLKKLWRLFYYENNFIVTNEQPSPEELKVLHKTIKKIEEDTERFSFNTSVSAFMVCVNELTDLKCHKKDILVPLIILLTPYAPHVSCELWEMIKVSPTIGGGDLEGAVLDASFPKLEQKFLMETSKEYPISVNGKLRTTINIDLAAEPKEIEEIVLQNTVIQKWLEGKPPKKIIFVKNKMVNVVV